MVLGLKVQLWRCHKSLQFHAVSALKEAIEQLGGLSGTARLLGVSVRAVGKWRDAGHLPRTELTGETDYSIRMARALASKSSKTEKALRETLLATAKRPPRKP